MFLSLSLAAAVFIVGFLMGTLYALFLPFLTAKIQHKISPPTPVEKAKAELKHAIADDERAFVLEQLEK